MTLDEFRERMGWTHQQAAAALGMRASGSSYQELRRGKCQRRSLQFMFEAILYIADKAPTDPAWIAYRRGQDHVVRGRGRPRKAAA